MRALRLMIALVLLLQLAKGERSSSDGVMDDSDVADDADPFQDTSTWGSEEKMEDSVADAEEEEEDGEQLHEEPEEERETPDERELSPRERLMMEDEERWQRGVEEVAEREREAALHESDPVEENPQEETEDNNDQEDEDESLAAYLDRKRRLEAESSDQSGDGDEEEEEALPIIPGLTEVELIAFNAEYANAEVLDKIIDWSYDQVAAVSRFRDNYIHVEDLYQFLLKTLNPLEEEIDQQDEEILTEAVAELRRQQGLVDEDQVVYRGFIARGMPLRFLQSLAHEMHQTVQTRRLQAMDRPLDEL